MRKYRFVVTKYWNNGEPWCDNAHSEYPIGVFDTIKDVDEYYSTKDLETVDVSDYAEHIAEYYLPNKEYEEVECPIDKVWDRCDQEYAEYDKEYCNNCWDTNWDISTDYSSETIRIYKVEEVYSNCNELDDESTVYACYLNDELYGLGSLDYMRELFDDYIFTCTIHGREQRPFTIEKQDSE